MKKHTIVAILFSLPLILLGQLEVNEIIGEYSDELGGIFTTKLELYKDSTFNLNTVDPEFPYTFESFTNEGKYQIIENRVVLNPNLDQRNIEVEINESEITTTSDSIHVKINYQVAYYLNNEIDTIEEFDFETLTILINKCKNSTHLTRYPIKRKCAFRRKVKNQKIINETNSIKLPNKEIERIGIYSYGFEQIIWIEIENKSSNNFEINVYHPIDRERMPRSKEVFIKKKKAYFYETDGKIDKSLTPLKRSTSR